MLATDLILYVFSGLLTGVLSGLLGLGGGLILVPLLSLVLGRVDIDSDLAMHLTIGTSIGCIFINSIGATLQRVRIGDFDYRLFKRLVTGLILGVIFGCTVGQYLSGTVLRYIFISAVLFAFFKTLHKFFEGKNNTYSQQETLPGRLISAVISCFSGFQGAVSGCGPTLVIVPFLNTYHYAMRKSSAQASALSAVIGLSGSISYIILGWGSPGLPHGSAGYIYLPALFPIVLFGFFGTKLGVKISLQTNDKLQKIIFLIFLIIIMVTMSSEIIESITQQDTLENA